MGNDGTKQKPRTYEQLGNDRLMSLEDVATALGFSKVTASKIIKESGKGIALHRRLFILESNILKYLRELEGSVK